MPNPTWKHSCSVDGGTSWRGQEDRCEECGEPYVYDGWHLGMYEAMLRYQAMYGLKPRGPHGELADAVLGKLCVPCETCGGESIVTNFADDTWSVCPRCKGLGSLWTVPTAEVAAARERVLEKFPDAAVPDTPDQFISALHDWEAGG